jgi:hypothetical protein
VAIERFRRDHAGELPVTLESLVPEYLSTIPAEPVTASTLLYRRGDGSYVVYGVGTDRKDDGAVRPFRRGPDVGVRVVIRE